MASLLFAIRRVTRAQVADSKKMFPDVFKATGILFYILNLTLALAVARKEEKTSNRTTKTSSSPLNGKHLIVNAVI